MKQVIIAMGSNIEPKVNHLSNAVDKMNNLDYLTVNKQSTVYQTVPKGYDDQDDFYNMVIEVSAETTPSQLINDLLQIELDLKRKRQIKNGPRTIDLDVLLMDDQISNIEELIVPHPRMHERAFVLVPLTEIAPDFVVPQLDKTVKELKESLPDEELNDVESIGSLSSLIEQE